jgi:integrase
MTSSPQNKHTPQTHAENDPLADSEAPAPLKARLDDGPPASAGVPAHLVSLADKARDYAKASSSTNTRRAYASDWRHFTAWARRQGLPVLPPDPRVVGLYITACASGAATAGAGGASGRSSASPGDRQSSSVATIERRLSALAWNFAQRGQPMDRADRHVATVLAGIRRTHGRPPEQKEAVLPEDLTAMIATLDLGDLRGLRDRAILLVGFAGGLRRSEIIGLDCGPEQTQDGNGWIEILDKGVVVTLRGKTGWREVEIGRGSSDLTCPVVALQTWLKFGRIGHGPLFRRVLGHGCQYTSNCEK